MRLTEAQRALLRDLAALQDAGMISSGGAEWVGDGTYDEGQVQIPAVVTPAGRAALAEEGS